MNWLGPEGLNFVQMLNGEVKQKFRTNAGLFEIVTEKFKP